MGADTSAPPRDSTLAAVQAEYLRALLDADVAAAREAIDGAVDAGADVRAIYLDVLQPTLHEVGRLWAQARISVAQEHLATAATQSAMARLASRLGSGRPRRRGTAVIACVSDELHAVGGRMVADFLQADGWEVVFLGALAPGADLAGLVGHHHPEVVALSAALPDRIPRVAEAVDGLRRIDPAPIVLVGGQAFDGDADRALRTGADLFAVDADTAVRELRDRFPAAA